MAGLTIGFALSVAPVAAGELPWDLETLSRVPATFPALGFEEPGVRSLFFEGPPYQGRPTRVFAWYGVPDLPAADRAPAVVLVHGGGGTAFAEWVRLWTSRGYAAIALDTCGCVPGGENAARPRHEHGGPAGWNPFAELDRPIGDQWVYHAVADVLLAHTLVRSFPEVDPDRTGITGISWGGYLTCIAAGVDPRFKFATPVYGCGFLEDDSAWAETIRSLNPVAAGRWRELWEPSLYLRRAEMPFLWVTGTNDFAYPLNSLQRSYRLTRGPRTLAIRIRMPHGHGGAGENPEEIRVFADSVVKGGSPLAAVEDGGFDGKAAHASVNLEAKLAAVELCYTLDEGGWTERHWQSLPVQVREGEIAAELPAGVTAYFFNAVDDRGLVVSTEHVEPPVADGGDAAEH